MIEILIMTIVIVAIASINKGKKKSAEEDLPQTNYNSERKTSSVYEIIEELNRSRRPVPPSPPPLQTKFTEVPQVKTTYASPKSSQKSTAGKSNALSHPIFKIENLTPNEITQRAIVIREILGPPVSLRDF
jgi:hypothetical protein